MGYRSSPRVESRPKAKKPPLTLNLESNSLKVTSEPPPMAGQAGYLQGHDRSAVTHPSSSHARRCLIRLSCDDRCIRYTAPLALAAAQPQTTYLTSAVTTCCSGEDARSTTAHTQRKS
ncbi:hypothetical protein J6590_062860 [Homalodisca vitripennis]|nr:hypothetical protein J6590_062860 [Homalodisca vitripennis]